MKWRDNYQLMDTAFMRHILGPQTMIENEAWKQIGAEGHTYWATDEKPNRIAVADYSMRIRDQPGSTDDGLMLLDRSRWIVFDQHSGRKDVSIPLTKADGSETQTCGSFKEAVFLAQKFGMRVSICGVLFEPAKIMCAVPECEDWSVTHMLIAINNESKKLLPVCKVHADAALEDKPTNETKG